MAVQWVLVCHGLVTLLVVVSFLCGQWPIFQGTFIQRIHHFLTFGAFDYLRRFVEFVFGSRGTNALYLTQYYCCDRPNPILQAYVQQLEASRLKLLQLEQELEQTKAQCALMSAGVNAGQLGFPGAANSGIAAFEIEYERWVEEQNKRTNALKTALKSSMSEDDLSNLVTDTFNHYASLFTIKENAAKTDVCYLISGVWKTSTERLFLWIGGFRPSDLLKVLVPQLELLDQQSHDLYNLIPACQEAEDSLSQGMEKLQQTLADAVGRGAALGEGSYEMHKAIEKLEELVRVVIQADYVRKETLHQTLRNLTPRQAAQGLISLGEYFQRLRDLSSAWAMRLCEPENTMFLS